MGLLSDLNWQGAARGLGQGLADTGRAGMLNAFEEKRQKRLASFNAELRATERAEDREYEQGLLSEARQYEEGKTASAQGFATNERVARQEFEAEQSRLDRESQESVAKTKAGANGASPSSKATSIKEYRDDLRSGMSTALGMEGDWQDWDDDQRKLFLDSLEASESIAMAGVAEGKGLDDLNQGSVMKYGAMVAKGEIDIGAAVAAVTGKPVTKPEAASEMPDMPPAAAHEGRTIRDTETGKRYRSNGSTWEEI